jgi:predicted ATPase/transcriptional regulator with XRE-family HTH domain
LSSETSFASLLRHHRIASGISQERLAELSEISLAAISALERGMRRAPYPATVKLLAVALGISGQKRAQFEAAAERARVAAKMRPPSGERRPEAPDPLALHISSFVGRVDQLADIAVLIRRHRLVSVTGSGGIGKTRTCLEVLRPIQHEWPGGVLFVDLSTTNHERSVLAKLAAELRVEGRADPITFAAIASVLRGQTPMLLLDNCEHVVEATARIVADIIASCPGVSILTTTRERLAIAGEVVYQLPALALPTDNISTVSEARRFSAVELFEHRAAAASHGFTLRDEDVGIVNEICRRLDGIPLAIELAAARVPIFALRQLQASLADLSYGITGRRRSVPARQQTLAATLGWSWNLLTTVEQIVFRRLAIFSGGWTIEAAEAVCSEATIEDWQVTEALASLVDKSLVDVDTRGRDVRYNFLNTTRGFAFAALEAASEAATLRVSHARWFADFAERMYALSGTPGAVEKLEVKIAEVDNALAAIEWALGPAGDVVLGGRIIYGLTSLWQSTGRLATSARWATSALERIDETAHPVLAGRLHSTLSHSVKGAFALREARLALPFLEREGDLTRVINACGKIAYELSRQEQSDEAASFIDKADAIIAGTRISGSGLGNVASYLMYKVLFLLNRGRVEEALETGSDCVFCAKSYDDRFAVFSAQIALAEVEFQRGNTTAAIERVCEAIAYGRPLKNAYNQATALSNLAGYFTATGRYREAAATASEALSISHDPNGQIALWCILHLAAIAAVEGHKEAAARLLGFFEREMARNPEPMVATELSSYRVLHETLSRTLDERARELHTLRGALLSSEAARAEALAVAACTG